MTERDPDPDTESDPDSESVSVSASASVSDANANADTDADSESYVTDKNDIRWVYLGSLTSLLLACSLVVLVTGGAAGYVSLEAVPTQWYVLYGTAVVTSIGWTFGKELLDDWRK